MSTINEQLDSLLNIVIDKCSGLFSENQRYFRTFERGIYACALLKPSKRMHSNLGTEREILLVSSTFEDQQQRTIKFIASEIENYKGRLETTIAMVIHLDREGDHRLRNWVATLVFLLLLYMAMHKFDHHKILNNAYFPNYIGTIPSM